MSNICTCPNQTGSNVNKTLEDGKRTCFVCNKEVVFIYHSVITKVDKVDFIKAEEMEGFRLSSPRGKVDSSTNNQDVTK